MSARSPPTTIPKPAGSAAAPATPPPPTPAQFDILPSFLIFYRHSGESRNPAAPLDSGFRRSGG